MTTAPLNTDSGHPALTLGEFRALTRELPDGALLIPVHREQVQHKDHEFLAYQVTTAPTRQPAARTWCSSPTTRRSHPDS